LQVKVLEGRTVKEEIWDEGKVVGELQIHDDPELA
jgi:hypothetical protein